MGAALRAAAATLALFVAAPFPALAHDHEPPRALLRHGALEQEGRLIALRWTEPAGPDGCTSTLLLAKPRYPREGLPVGQGDFRARIRFAKPARPLSVQAVARPELDVEDLHRDVAVERRIADAKHGCEAPLSQQGPHGKFRAQRLLQALLEGFKVHGGAKS